MRKNAQYPWKNSPSHIRGAFLLNPLQSENPACNCKVPNRTKTQKAMKLKLLNGKTRTGPVSRQCS